MKRVKGVEDLNIRIIRRSGYCGRGCHHPHVHMIVPGGGISLDGERWIVCRPGFLLPVRVLSRAVPRACSSHRLTARARRRPACSSSASLAGLADRRAFTAPPRRRCAGTNGWSTPSRPSPGPKRCSPISPATPIASPSPTAGWSPSTRRGVTFRWKDYRRDGARPLAGHDARRRRVHPPLPAPRPARGFHRIRHYGLLASSARKASLARARELLAVAPPPDDDVPDEPLDVRPPCPCCGGHMIIIETFERWRQPRAPPHCTPPSRRNSP